MKNTPLHLTCISAILLFSTAPALAVEKKVIFNTESMNYESGTGSERCRDKCGRMSGPDAKLLLSEGWKIVKSSSKEVIGEQYWYVPCNTCKPHGCVCIGTEYILQKDEPAPTTEAKNSVSKAPVKDNLAEPYTRKVEASKNELGLLKKEIDLLKQENALLKDENEALRNQLRSIRK